MRLDPVQAARRGLGRIGRQPRDICARAIATEQSEGIKPSRMVPMTLGVPDTATEGERGGKESNEWVSGKESDSAGRGRRRELVRLTYRLERTHGGRTFGRLIRE